MILSTAEAEAVYSAMCALNNVGGLACNLSLDQAIFSSDFRGAIRIVGPGANEDEEYPSQDAFRTAYGLN